MVSHLKKESDLSRLMSYAGGHKAFTYASWVLSAVSALMALVPFLYIWMILRDVLNAAPDYSKAVNIPHYGWMAVLFAVLSYLVYVLALLCSHTSAFRVATNMRLAVTEHIAKLPLGFTERYGSGRLRKVLLGFAIMSAMKENGGEDAPVRQRPGSNVKRSGRVRPRHTRGEDLRAVRVLIQKVQGHDR